MILDTGICSVFYATNTNQFTGGKPVRVYTLLFQSWYGELSFETSPARPTEGRRELKTDARIRVHQNRLIRQNDVVVLRQIETMADRDPSDVLYNVQRAYHGADPDNGELITDLSLEIIQP